MENEGSTQLSSEARHVLDGTGKELSGHVLCRCSKLQAGVASPCVNEYGIVSKDRGNLVVHC
jgi:hypothetical protein